MLPAAPCVIPFFTRRSLVAQAGGPGGGVAGAGLAVAGTVAVAVGVAVTVTVAVGAAAGPPLEPQAVTSAAMQASAAPAISRRAVVADDVIVASF